jgi:ribulose-5-phosphate 4-epimerase/fuculose-1-phosphate aldolase
VVSTETPGLREQIALACRVLGRLELTRAATGHISARVPGSDTMLIRGRGAAELGVRFTGPDEIIEADMEGRAVGANREGLAVPLEVYIHTEIYRARADVQAVVHMHPPIVMLFTICDVELLPIYGAYDPASAAMAVEGLPTFPSSALIDQPALGREFAASLGMAPACLMRGHGITSVGSSVEAAALTTIRLNELATINFQAHQLGTPRVIPVTEQDAIRRKSREASKAAASASSERDRNSALWRYYCTVTAA